MSGGGGGVIIIGSVVETASLETVVMNLTPAECAERDAIICKLVGDICAKDVARLNALIVKALRRCK